MPLVAAFRFQLDETAANESKSSVEADGAAATSAEESSRDEHRTHQTLAQSLLELLKFAAVAAG